MKQDRTAIERAFELARSGKCRSVSELRQTLREEGYNSEQISGPLLLAQLKAIFEEKQ